MREKITMRTVEAIEPSVRDRFFGIENSRILAATSGAPRRVDIDKALGAPLRHFGETIIDRAQREQSALHSLASSPLNAPPTSKSAP